MRRLLVTSLVTALCLVAVPAAADEPEPSTPDPAVPTVMTLEVPEDVVAATRFTAMATLTTANGPVASAEVRFTTSQGGGGSAVTDAQGRASVVLEAPRSGPLVVSAAFRGSESLSAVEGTVSRTVRKQSTRLTLTTPRSVRDGHRLYFKVTGRTSDGAVVQGVVTFIVKEPGRALVRRVPVRLANGAASGSVRVFGPASVVASMPASAVAEAGTSVIAKVAYAPAGQPVRLPGPRPRITLPPQKLAHTDGASVRVMPIPDAVWKDMRGRSWRPGCTPRSRLRLIKTNYWSFDGYRRQGELVVSAAAAGKFRTALQRMHDRRIPIRHMYRVDRFGYHKGLRGANDYSSMAADNTSAFNCRGVVGNPSRRSPHATGRSLDINPWENPFHSRHGWTPNTYWVGKSHGRVAWRTHQHLVVRVLKSSGFRWTYGAIDAHHFDA